MKKVLIVDNSSYMRMFAKKILEKEGSYSISEASGKTDALDVFQKELHDIVILDLNMSEFTMDGLDVLADIMKIKPETAVFIVSAVGHEAVKEKCLSLGAKGYIKKPFDATSLLKALGEYK